MANFGKYEFLAEFFTPKPARGGQANLGGGTQAQDVFNICPPQAEKRNDKAISSILNLKFSENQNLLKYCKYFIIISLSIIYLFCSNKCIMRSSDNTINACTASLAVPEEQTGNIMSV